MSGLDLATRAAGARDALRAHPLPGEIAAAADLLDEIARAVPAAPEGGDLAEDDPLQHVPRIVESLIESTPLTDGVTRSVLAGVRSRVERHRCATPAPKVVSGAQADELPDRALTDEELRDLGRRIADTLDEVAAFGRDDEIDHANSDSDAAEQLGTLARELRRYGWVMDERMLRLLAPLAAPAPPEPALVVGDEVTTAEELERRAVEGTIVEDQDQCTTRFGNRSRSYRLAAYPLIVRYVPEASS